MSSRKIPSAKIASDARFMKRALALAARGLGRVEPNPMVGCVLVRRGRVIAEGWHRRFGGPHAEIEALRKARGSARGATAYVTLEPCCITAKTPPCTRALIEAKLRRVVVGTRDPNPKVFGGGIRRLRRAGIVVDEGVLAEEAAQLIAPFAKWIQTQRPWVILKWAQSLDGTIATRTKDSKWISDAASRDHAHRTRGRVDAILVGVNTVLTDDPQLTCRAGRPRRIATRVVLDSKLRTPLASNLAQTAGETPTIIFCGPDAALSRRKRLERSGCVVESVPRLRNGLKLGSVLVGLGKRQIASVLVEGGGRVLGAFLDERLADELHVYIAPLLIGGRDAVGALDAIGPKRVRNALQLPPETVLRRLGNGWLARAVLSNAPQDSPAY